MICGVDNNNMPISAGKKQSQNLSKKFENLAKNTGELSSLMIFTLNSNRNKVKIDYVRSNNCNKINVN
jgi:hypothetical protein